MKKYISILTLSAICALIISACGGTDMSSKMPDRGDEVQESRTGDDTVADESANAEKEVENAGGGENGALDNQSGEMESSGNANEASDGNSKEAAEGMSLASRMVGKYSCYVDNEEPKEDEYLTMDVMKFGDNLCAFCGAAMDEGDGTHTVYSFWASEFIPYDAEELRSTDGDSAMVKELNFSIMSNASKYWGSGKSRKISLTDEGLLIEDSSGDGESTLFTKDDRVEDAFGYLKDEAAGIDSLQGVWMLEEAKAPTYLQFQDSNLYIYHKDPAEEVFFAAVGCDFEGSSFTGTGNTFDSGSMPFEISADYKVEGNELSLVFSGLDIENRIPSEGLYKHISEEDVHVTTTDELSFTKDSFGPFGLEVNTAAINEQDYYGVFVAAFKNESECQETLDKLMESGFMFCPLVYTPDFSELNPEPYYVVSVGLFTSEEEADELLAEVKGAGFKDAYTKYAGNYTGDRYWFTRTGIEEIEIISDGVIFKDVSVSIPYTTDSGHVTMDLFVGEDAVFDKTAQTDSFGNYEAGDTPYSWILRNYKYMSEDAEKYMSNGPALAGIFEVGFGDMGIDRFYGSYWWD